MIGILGSVIFEVSTDYIKTFDNFSRESQARYAKHDVLGIKPVKQYIGPELDKIKFKMQLSLTFGTNPLQEISTLRDYMGKGEVVTLIIGNTNLGNFTIQNINEDWTVVDKKGNLISAQMEIELEEYIKNIPKITKKILSKNTTSKVVASKSNKKITKKRKKES